MREIPIKSLYKALSKEMNSLPFAVTKNGKVIGYVVESLDMIQPRIEHKPKSLDRGFFNPMPKTKQASGRYDR